MDDFVPFSNSSSLDESKQKDAAPALLTGVPAPWLESEIADHSLPPFVRLHNEILLFCEYISPTPQELNRRQLVLDEIKEIVHKLWPKSSVHVFGSQLTRILTPTSDLDCAILDVPEETSLTENLYAFANAFRENKKVTYMEVITGAKVPIIKFDHSATGISVDICLNNRSGLDTGKLIRALVREYPPLRPLTMAMKVFLSQRKLNDTYTGGLGSFVLCAMIASFLQMRKRLERRRKVQLTWNLGALLVELFHLYGNTFNYMHTGISIKDGGLFFRKRERKDWENPNRPSLIAVENPDCPELDMGRNSFQMPKIRRSMEHAHQLLTSALSDSRISSYLSFVVRPDDPVLANRPLPALQSTASRTNLAALNRFDGEEDCEEETDLKPGGVDGSMSSSGVNATGAAIAAKTKNKKSKAKRSKDSSKSKLSVATGAASAEVEGGKGAAAMKKDKHQKKKRKMEGSGIDPKRARK